MNLDEALAEHILDQMKDRPRWRCSSRPTTANSRLINLSPAHREFAALGVAETAHGEPMLAARDAGAGETEARRR
jgi:hypothetical protein